MRNLVPIITPFLDDLSLDFMSYMNHVEFLYEHGIRGLVIGGTTGESVSLSDSEREMICGNIKATYPDIKLAGCIAVSDLRSTATTLHAFRQCDLLLVMPPMFVRPSNDDVLDFFAYIMSLTDKPIMLYNNPARTKVDISSLYTDLCKNKQIIGVKETVSLDAPPSVPWWCGEDSHACDSMSSGCSGIISACANILPKISCAIVNNTASPEQASKWNYFTQLILSYVNPLPVKYILHKLGVIRNPHLRFAIKLRDTAALDQAIGMLTA